MTLSPRKRVLFRLMLILSVVGLAPVVSEGSASAAVSCTTDTDHAFSGGAWNPSGTNFAAGVEAPVQLRTTSNICKALGGHEGDQASEWIAIQPPDGSFIVQIGFVKVIDDPVTGSVKNCRFWAMGVIAQVHLYGTCNDSGGDRVWFRITAQPDPDTQTGHYYFIEDCGPDGGYDGCVTKNAAQAASGDGTAPMLGEVSYPCDDQLGGSSTARVNIGTSSYPVKGQNGFGDAWATRSLTPYLAGPCSSHFHNSVTNTIIQIWDDRN